MNPRPFDIPARRLRARRSGFSLIESMVVVSIVGIMAAAVLPAMTEMVASTRQTSAANEMMLLARSARREAMLGGKYAYSFVFSQAAGNGQGAARIVTGVSAFCNRGSGVNFGTDPTTGIVLPNGWQAFGGFVNLNPMALGPHRIFATMEMPDGTGFGLLRICYTPGGETFVSIGLNGVPFEQTQTAVMRINRSVGGGIRGVDRQVVFLPGGTARLR